MLVSHISPLVWHQRQALSTVAYVANCHLPCSGCNLIWGVQAKSFLDRDLNSSPSYRLVQSMADRSFHIRANVCDPTKTIVKHSLHTLICSTVFRDSEKELQRAGFSTIEHIRSHNEQ